MALNGKRVGLVLAILLVVILIAAWIDGGEEALHPIEEPVALPGAAR